MLHEIDPIGLDRDIAIASRFVCMCKGVKFRYALVRKQQTLNIITLAEPVTILPFTVI